MSDLSERLRVFASTRTQPDGPLATALHEAADTLDATEEALEHGETSWSFLANMNAGVELDPEVRSALAAENMRLILAARASSPPDPASKERPA